MRAMSWLVCMRISVSMETPNAFSILSAISGERPARSFSSADSAGRARRPGHRQAERLDNVAFHESPRVGRVLHSDPS